MAYGRIERGIGSALSSQRGVVLITVLWVLILLSLIAGNLSLAGRGFARQTQNIEQSTIATQAANGGLVWALWSLQQDEQNSWLADGSAHRMKLGEVWVNVELYDESGKLDLNAAPTELLDALLKPVVEEDGRRAALVAAIEDWRDEDDLIRLNGAEEEEYLAAGRKQGPANRSFESVRELLSVLGMDLEIYRQVSSNLTVRSGVRSINPVVASFEVLMTLPNASEGVVQGYIDDRRSAWSNRLPMPELPFDGAPYVSDTRSGIFFTAISSATIEPYTRIRNIYEITRRGQVPSVELAPPLLDGDMSQPGSGESSDEK
ncbi:hypothetical protein GCM10011352_30340 [Marinobacterium zhoushanense]|uniref:T2SS protein K first SAM-like domain-containing protein n=1 Tax=Marinobacterium zhoushanense TaxID=1679163 RepID=A0ABQ1KJS8_9GAMM|nr:type II secretion system protein GspK [Marinobacterium zhoushanense]GGC02073.1 hypothetical protein GCM10011352_30340 [Marinobacterium zhoushanense]